MENQRRAAKRAKKRAEARNLCVLSLTFFLVLTVYNGIEIVQQDLYPKLGTAAAATVFGTTMLSSIFLAVPVLNFIGVKWGIFALCISHVLYAVVNFYPTWGSLLPFSILLGVGSAIGWAGLGVYMAALANKFSILAHREKDRVLSVFWGVFFWYNGLARPLGYYISQDIMRDYMNVSDEASPTPLTTESTLLPMGNSTIPMGNATLPMGNSTGNFTDYLLEEFEEFPEFSNETFTQQVCGAGYCPNEETQEQLLLLPQETNLYWLMGVYLVASISGSVASITLPGLGENQEVFEEDDEGPKKKFIPLKTFWEMLKVCKDYRPLLLICPYLASGVVRAMHIWSYNRAFIRCALGSSMSGWAMFCDGLGYSFTAFFSGYLVKFIPRSFHVVSAAILNIILAVTWLTWRPDADATWVFFVLATLQGCTNGVWRVHTMTITGILFPDSLAAAYAHLMVWDCLGHVIVFGYNNFLCFHVIAALFICLIIAALGSYLFLELVFIQKVILCKKKRRKADEEAEVDGYLDSSIDTFEFDNNNHREEMKALMAGIEMRTSIEFEDC